jgi:hypothetical protein
MGDYADDLRDAMMEVEALDAMEDWVEFNDDGQPLWETPSGRTVRICDMDTAHILNAINLIRRTQWRLEHEPYLVAELAMRAGG